MSQNNNNNKNNYSITSLKEKGGFWIPNEFIDKLAPHIRATGVWIYCTIARCSTLVNYPSVDDLIEICETTRNRVENVLDTLLEEGYINYHDIKEIRRE